MPSNTIDTLNIKVQSSAQNAVQEIDKLTASLTKLGTALNGPVQGLTNLNKNLKGIKSINTSVGNVGKSFDIAGKYMTMFKKIGNGIVSVFHNQRSASDKLASSIGTLYAKYFLLVRAIKAIGSAVEESMDYVENYNYFAVALKTVADSSSSAWAEAGYDSAQAYSDAISSEMQNQLSSLNDKLTGYITDSNGFLVSSGNKNLGLDMSEITGFQARILAITNSLGEMGDVSEMTAESLTMLATDLSSITNQDLSKVMSNLTSGLVGQSRVMYQYGVDITNAGLAQTALEHGITKSVSSMTQAEKAQLRLVTILEQTRYAWGDQANTISTAANQYRVFKTQVASLARTIGNILLPIVKFVLPYINAVIIAIKELLTLLGFKIYGSSWSDDVIGGISGGTSDVGDYADSLDDVSDSYDDVADAADDATDAAKEYQKTLLSIDQIHALNAEADDSSSDSGSGSGSSGTGGTGGGVDLSDALAGLLDEYNSIYNQALEDARNKAQEIADTFLDYIKNGDYFGAGKYIADQIADGLESIDWNNIQENLRDFGNKLGEFLAGLLDPRLGYDLGMTLAEILNSMFSFALGVVETDELWTRLGEFIHAGIKGALDNIDWDIIQEFAVNLGTGIGTAINEVFDPELFHGIGDALAEYLNTFVDFFDSLGTTIDWSSVGLSLAELVNGFFDTFDFDQCAETINTWCGGLLEAIRSFLKGLDWMEMFNDVTDFIIDLMNGSGGLVLSLVLALPLISTAADFTASLFKSALTTALSSALGGLLGSATLTSAIAGGLLTFSLIGLGLIVGLGIAKIAISMAEGVKTFDEEVDLAYQNGEIDRDMWYALKGLPWYKKASLSVDIEAGVDWDDLDLTTWSDRLKEKIEGWVDGVKEYFAERSEKTKEFFSNPLKAIRDEIKSGSGTSEEDSDWYDEQQAKLDAENSSSKLLQIIKDSIGEKFKDFSLKDALFGNNIDTSFLKADASDAIPIDIKAKITTTMDSAFEWIKEKIQDGKDLTQNIKASISDASVSSIVTWLLEKLRDKTDTISATISGSITSATTATSNIFSYITNAIMKASSLTATIKGSLTSATTATSNIFAFIINKIMNAASSLSATVTGKITSGTASTGNIFAYLINKIMNAATLTKTVTGKMTSGSSSTSNMFAYLMYKIFKSATISKTIAGYMSSKSTKDSNIFAWVINKLKNGMTISATVVGTLTGALSSKANGGILVNGAWQPIQGYASGGYPQSAQMFMARENGIPELVGRIGSNTAVMNNNQIVSSVAAGVAQAVASVMSSYYGRQSNGNIEVLNYIGDDAIYRAYNRASNATSKRFTSQPSFV